MPHPLPYLSRMPLFNDFPSGDSYWVVKWIDKFMLPRLTTRSALVHVRLQRLPFQNFSDLNRLSRNAAVSLLHRDRTDPGHDRFETLSMHAGLLPGTAIGRVYQRNRLVGELPTTQASIVLPEVEQSCMEVRIDEELEAPSSWGGYPYPLLRSSEFDGISTEFGRSRCLVFTSENGIEYIIPRAVIFRKFYAPHREFANAFTSGPWVKTKSRVVYEGLLQSGLKTQIDPETGEWQIILQTHVEDSFAYLAALMYFDEYANACAESIYAGMLSDRHGGSYSPWFASAKLPFRAAAEPLQLDVKGFMLPPRLGKRGPDGKHIKHKQSFLVTSILGTSWPSYLPREISHNRYNGGDKGLVQTLVDGRRPYSNNLRGQPAGDDLVVTSDVDASATESDAVILEDTSYWLNGPELKKIVKNSSQQYRENKIAPPPAPPPSTASGGERTHQGGSAAPAHHKAVVRDPVNRFRYLLNAFESLQNDEVVQWHSVFQPAVPSQMSKCGGLICWNFLDEMARKTGRWPNGGWRMLERASMKGSERILGQPRSALVVRVEFGHRTGYWFEIETREAKGGLLSPFIADLQTDEQEAAQHIIESIARANGRNLRQVMARVTRELGSGITGCYKHQYKGDHNSELDANSLRRFLARLQ